MLVVIVQLLYDVIHQADYQIEQKRQIQANSGSQRQWSRQKPLYMRTSSKRCIHGMKPAVRGVNKTVFLLSVYTRLPYIT